ncbi:hypothetical protein IAR55_006136 [Kwoniella newhampshirensis]|uniref:J domain-containing protein n=1 Tax=Kwoniella newhampshirensis TaxID=1651941 RepID=A0AAW0YTZ5_9TREE
MSSMTPGALSAFAHTGHPRTLRLPLISRRFDRRPHSYSLSSSSDGDADADTPSGRTLDDVLVNQDPYKRIWFGQPLVFINEQLDGQRFARIRRDWPQATQAVPHLIPFWIISLLCDQRAEHRHRSTNGPDYNNVAERFQSEIGFRVAAVREDHWCSGKHFPHSLRFAMDTNDWLAETNSGIFLPSPTPNIYTEPLPAGRADPFMNPEWSEMTAPKFALGPPRFEKGEMERIVALQGAFNAEWDEVLIMAKDIKIFAVPIYRLTYKITLRDGTAYTDGEIEQSIRVDWPRGQIQPIKEGPFGTIGNQLPQCRPARDGTNRFSLNSIGPPSRSAELMRIVMNAMRRRGPMTDAMWEDERILPLIAPSPVISGQGVQNYVNDHVLGRRTLDEPLYPIKRPQVAPTPSSLFSARSSLNYTKRAPANSTSSSSSSGSSSRSTGETSSQGSATSRYGPSWAGKRDSYVSSRARLQHERVRQTLRSPQQASKQKPVYPDILPDPRRYYKILGIDIPRSEMLDVDKREGVDEMISIRYVDLAMKRHPDRGGSTAEMTMLNEANRQIETLERRLAYFEGRDMDKENRKAQTNGR